MSSQFLLLAAVFGFVSSFPGESPAVDETLRWKQCLASNQSIYDFQAESLLGEYKDLSEYKGKVILLVNVASFCAYTQQYTDFNPMLEKYRSRGFTIVAFPSNQFYLQEPPENHEIMNALHYVRPGNGWKPHEELHILGKIDVNGDNQHPLYEFVKEACPQTVDKIGRTDELMYNPVRPSDITWNFEKFLIDRKGQPRFRFHPTAWSHGNVVTPFLEQLLEEKP
uniref:Glutathione peroxidase n=1 Tax=Caenorhabditis japonica TaxID=281687 RepID=A0A8R1HGM2_CAEJA